MNKNAKEQILKELFVSFKDQNRNRMTINTVCLGTVATPYGKTTASLCIVLVGVFCWHTHAYPMFSELQNIAGI